MEDAVNVWTLGQCSRREYIRSSIKWYVDQSLLTVRIFVSHYKLAAFFVIRKTRSPSRTSLIGRIVFEF